MLFIFFCWPKIGLTLTMGGLFFSGHCRDSGSVFGSENLSFGTSGDNFGTLGSILGGPVWPDVAWCGPVRKKVPKRGSRALPWTPPGHPKSIKTEKMGGKFLDLFFPDL